MNPSGFPSCEKSTESIGYLKGRRLNFLLIEVD